MSNVPENSPASAERPKSGHEQPGVPEHLTIKDADFTRAIGLPQPALEFLDTLRNLQLLSIPHFNELIQQDLQARLTEPRDVARFLLDRGWLTAYQVNHLLQGNGADLFVDHYVLLERLGEGATGQVFKARHQQMNRLAAVKLLRPQLLSDAEVLQRFYREIEVVGRLSHPNVIAAYDAGPARGTHFIAMEFVEGTDLNRLVRACGPVAWPQACDYIRQAALGLQHAHEKGLVHRDIKPANLFLSRRTTDSPTAEGIVKLLDLGLARLHQSMNESILGRNVTLEGVLIGTPDFMPPEQTIDAREVDIRGDIYSLGCSLYFLLSGGVLFPDCTLVQKLLKIQQTEPTPIEQLCPGLPPGVVAVVRRMIAKRPGDRFQTPAEVVMALSANPITAEIGPTTLTGREDLTLRMGPTATAPRGALTRRRFLLGAAGGGAVLVAGLGIASALRRPSPESNGAGTASPSRPIAPNLFTNSLGMSFVRIQPGSLKVSVSGEPTIRSLHIHQPYWLGAQPVTVGDFRAYVKATNYRTDAETKKSGVHCGVRPRTLRDDATWENPRFPADTPQSERHPVVCITWSEATAFCEWLSRTEGARYRLPTEEEWEYACRAGTRTRFYCGQSLSGNQANFNGLIADDCRATPFIFVGSTTPVGTYPPNPFGLYDMHGNVFEWCAYSGGTVKHMVRGGCWADQARLCASSHRDYGPDSFNVVGFRIVREI